MRCAIKSEDRREYMRRFGKRLRAVREEKFGVRKSYALAQKANISAGDLSSYERGRLLPSLLTLSRLCEALECTPNDLLIGLLEE